MSVFMLAKFTNLLFEYADSSVRYQLLHFNFKSWLSQITTKVIRNVLTTKWRNTNVLSMLELLGGRK